MKQQRRAKILIVDDNPANLLAMDAVLRGPEYELFEATSGEEAIAQCLIHEFALILLDINMPGLDGYQTAKQIKTLGMNQDVPIIFVTATYRDDPHVKRGFEVGAVDYFGKPFDSDILRTKVGIYTDLYLKTKRLHETEELLKTHAQIKILLDAMPVGVIVADADGKVYESNDEARQIWGCYPHLEPEEYKSCKMWWADSGERIDAEKWGLNRALEEGKTTKDQLVEIDAFDGKRKSILVSTYPIKGKAEQTLGAVLVAQDVTSRREIADDLHRRAMEL